MSNADFGKVVIDDFDAYVDSLSGPAKELVFDLYGAKVSKRTAESLISGARKHISQKKKLLEEGEAEFIDETFEFAEDGSRTVTKVIELSEADMQNDFIILRKMGLDPMQWTLKSAKFHRKAYQTPMRLRKYDEEHNRLSDVPIQKTNHSYNCEIRVEPIQNKIRTNDVLEAIKGLESPEAPKRNYKKIDNGKMLELPIMDDHWGLHAWKDETLDAHWDLDITTRVHKEIIEDILRKRGYEKYKEIHFPIGQDTFHVDTVKNTTSAGTVMDTDGRWPKIFSVALQEKIWAIEQLRPLGPVFVYYVPGNHDEMMAYAAVQAIGHHYRHEDDVIVPDFPFPSPSPRKYIRFGVNQIGFSHGRDETKKNLEGIMQQEDKEVWGQTEFHEMHLGDLHHERTWEQNGIIFRRISAICPVSSWENGRAYSAVRKALAYEWDAELGLDGIIPANVRL